MTDFQRDWVEILSKTKLQILLGVRGNQYFPPSPPLHLPYFPALAAGSDGGGVCRASVTASYSLPSPSIIALDEQI